MNISMPPSPPCGGSVYLQGPWLSWWLSLPGLLDQLTVELILQLRVCQAHLQSTLGQRHMVVDGRGINGYVDEELTRLKQTRHSAFQMR